MRCNLAPKMSRLHGLSSCKKMLTNIYFMKQKKFQVMRAAETQCRSRFHAVYLHHLWRRHRCGIVRFIKNVPHASGSHTPDRRPFACLTD